MLAAAAVALVVERFVGYPALLQATIKHPVQWMGAVLEWLELALWRGDAGAADQRFRGVAALAGLLLLFGLPSYLISYTLHQVSFGWAAEALLATTLLAQHSLRQHVAAVGSGLARSLAEGREAVSHIVGRDPNQLDHSGVSRAALESLAENMADGVVAPLFWFAVAGLPGIVAYKAINTADSMIGHKSERYLHFGWAAARLDDLVNLPASRLSALLVACAAPVVQGNPAQVLRTAWRDAGKHQSPNAGWPESAFAAALGLSLGGPRSYADGPIDLPYMGDGRSELTGDDINRGLSLYGAALSWLLGFCVAGALVF